MSDDRTPITDRVIVAVFDGLRPDMVTSEFTPNILRLADRGTWFRQARSVFPSVTRVATTSIATGALKPKVAVLLAGVLNLVYGIAAIGDSQFYVRDVKYVIGDLKTWGWFLTILGAVQVITAIGVFRASEAARWLGIGFAAANMIVQFLVLPAQPVWAIMVFFIDVIIIFGLLTYGGRDRHNLA